MKDDLRTVLTALADRIATAMETPSQPAASEAPSDGSRALIKALAAMADGDFSRSVAAALAGSESAAPLEETLRRVRELVIAARGVVAAGTDRIEEVRSAAERAADGASRQRVALEKTAEQVKQLSQRLTDLTSNAGDIGEFADRASLLALNTGIEGLRVGGEVARTLGSLGEELRKLSQKTSGNARDLVGGLKALSEQARITLAAIDDARTAARATGDEAARAASAADSARRADNDLAQAVNGFRALDEETEVIVARLDATAQRIARELDDAAVRFGATDEPGRAAIRAAMQRLHSTLDKAGDGRGGKVT